MANAITPSTMLDNLRNATDPVAKTIALQLRMDAHVRELSGDPLPMAIGVGERPMEPFVFRTAAEEIERLSGRLISERG